MDVTLNVILGNMSCGANVTLAHGRRRTNVTLASIRVRLDVTPDPPDVTPADANVTLGQPHDQLNVTPDPTNVTLTLGMASSVACQRGILRRQQLPDPSPRPQGTL